MRVGIDARKIADYGIGTYIRGLLGALANGEDEIVAFAPRDAKLPDGIEHVVVDAPHYSIAEIFVVGRAADRARLDLFHAPHYVVPRTRVPVVVTIHDLIQLHRAPRNPLETIYARLMIGRAIRVARRVVTVSEAVKRELTTAFLCSPQKIAVTPNGIDARFFAEGPAASGRYFLFAGNDKPHKNVDVLVDAFTRMRRDERLVLCGGDFSRFAAIDGVVTAGFVSDDELAALMRGACALVMPSREEGFGLPAAEAMACGTAVITSRAGALVEVTGDAALHVDANARALAAAMQCVANDESLRAMLAARGRERARTMTWTRCAELTRAAWRDAIS